MNKTEDLQVGYIMLYAFLNLRYCREKDQIMVKCSKEYRFLSFNGNDETDHLTAR